MSSVTELHITVFECIIYHIKCTNTYTRIVEAALSYDIGEHTERVWNIVSIYIACTSFAWIQWIARLAQNTNKSNIFAISKPHFSWQVRTVDETPSGGFKQKKKETS